MTRRDRHTAAIGRRAFTLVEMLIVIGVILLLTALTAMVTAGFLRASEVRETRNTMTVLDQALSEWQIAADRDITYGINPLPPADPVYDVDRGHVEDDGDPHYEETILELVGIIERTAAAREIIANIDPEFLQELDDPDDPGATRLGVRDPWDNSFRVVFPGRLWIDQNNDGSDDLDSDLFRDADGTIRTGMEIIHGVAANRRLYFVSAGPDGEWGNLHLDTAEDSLDADQRAEVEAAADNVYSYEVLRTRPTP